MNLHNLQGRHTLIEWEATFSDLAFFVHEASALGTFGLSTWIPFCVVDGEVVWCSRWSWFVDESVPAAAAAFLLIRMFWADFNSSTRRRCCSALSGSIPAWAANPAGPSWPPVAVPPPARRDASFIFCLSSQVRGSSAAGGGGGSGGGGGTGWL